MGRFHEGDDCDYEPGWYGRWRGQVANAVRSKKGQAFFRELRDALEAMPDKRLIESELSKDGCTCALGALAIHRRVLAGEQRECVLADLAKTVYDHDDDRWDGEEISEWAQHVLNCPSALAYEIPQANDDGGFTFVYPDDGSRPTKTPITPEQRYARMLGWVRSQIVEEPAA